MKLYIWKKAKNATRNYHTSGGVLIFSETLERARALLQVEVAAIERDLLEKKVSRYDEYKPGMEYKDTPGIGCAVFTEEPDLIVPVMEGLAVEENWIVFPNKGCC